MITGIEDEYYLKNEHISCAIVWYYDIKILIPVNLLVQKSTSKSIIRGMKHDDWPVVNNIPIFFSVFIFFITQ